MKILALPYGNSIAHVSRLLEIAKVLRSRGHELIFASEGKCLDVVKQENFTVLPLSDVSLEQTVTAFRTQNFSLLYGNAAEIETYVQAELNLYQKVKPDLVLTDARRTALVSTTLANLPHVAVVNAHITNYSQLPLLLPLWGTRVGYPLPKSLSTLLYNLQLKIERQVYNTALKGLQSVQRKHGLEPSFAYQAEYAKNLTLVADTPLFTPLSDPPQNFHYVGPITWQSNLPEPKFLEQFKSYKKRAYLVLGSGGFKEFFKYLSDFEHSGFAIAIAAGELIHKAPCNLPENVFLEKYINADALLPYCDVIVCHGGNGTIYQALKHSVPIVTIPFHNEQDYNARRVQQLGLGKRLSHKQVWQNFTSVFTTMEEVVDNASYRQTASVFQQHLNQWQGPIRAADHIEAYFNPTPDVNALAIT
ncbi:MAG: glycosyltransferase [Elainellaceae cyanobacterium]